MNRQQRVAQPKLESAGSNGQGRPDAFLDNPVMARNIDPINRRNPSQVLQGGASGGMSKSQERFKGNKICNILTTNSYSESRRVQRYANWK